MQGHLSTAPIDSHELVTAFWRAQPLQPLQPLQHGHKGAISATRAAQSRFTAFHPCISPCTTGGTAECKQSPVSACTPAGALQTVPGLESAWSAARRTSSPRRAQTGMKKQIAYTIESEVTIVMSVAI